MSHEADAEQVRALDEAWNRAYRERDVAALERLLADDWVALTPAHETVDKQTLLEGQRRASAEAVITFERGALWVFGDTAVSTGSTTVSAPGVNIHQRFTRVWAKRDRRWRAVAVQVVPILPPAP